MIQYLKQVCYSCFILTPLQPPFDADLLAFIRALPKAELHLHLEGSVEAETMRELDPSWTLDAIRSKLHFSGFAEFIQTYIWVTKKLDSPQAYTLITRRLLESLRTQNVQYAEITLSAGVILWKQQNLREIFSAIREECARSHDIEVRWIFDAIRHFGPQAAEPVFEAAADLKHVGVVAIGLGGDEERGPAGWFASLFEDARKAGLHLTCHAGETTNAQSVRDALLIGSERIGHGIRAVEEEGLLGELRERDIPLEICPSSNVVTCAVPNLLEHPLRRLWDAGVPIVLGSDDPALFRTNLVTEFALAANAFAFSREELSALAANSLRYRFA